MSVATVGVLTLSVVRTLTHVTTIQQQIAMMDLASSLTDVQTQLHVTMTQLQRVMMGRVYFLMDVPIQQHVTTTQQRHVMMGHVSLTVEVALIQQHVTTIQMLQQMMDLVNICLYTKSLEVWLQMFLQKRLTFITARLEVRITGVLKGGLSRAAKGPTL